MNKQRVICKYPNRRLYDTEISRYVTLTDLRKMVLDDVDFIIRERKTGSDVTRNVLLSIISDQEHGSSPVLQIESLRSVIRRQFAQQPGAPGVGINNHAPAAQHAPAAEHAPAHEHAPATEHHRSS